MSFRARSADRSLWLSSDCIDSKPRSSNAPQWTATPC